MSGRFSFTESLFRRVFHQEFVPHLEVGLHFGARRESVGKKKGGKQGGAMLFGHNIAGLCRRSECRDIRTCVGIAWCLR